MCSSEGGLLNVWKKKNNCAGATESAIKRLEEIEEKPRISKSI